MSDILGKSPAQRAKPRYFYTILSVAMVLFLFGFFGLLFIQAQQLTTVLKERVTILVEIQPATSMQLIDSLATDIRNQAYSKVPSIKIITKEEALMALQQDFGADFLNLDLPNPLYDVIAFNIKAPFVEEEQLHTIRQQLKLKPFVKDVYYQESLVQQIVSNIKKMSWLFLTLGILFLLIAITLIHNTVRLAMYANRFVLKNMELVGATWAFIRKPYVQRSIFHGIISAIIAIILLICVLLLTQNYIPEFTNRQHIPSLVLLFFGLLLLGMLINGLSTYIVVNKYLKMRLEDLY